MKLWSHFRIIHPLFFTSFPILYLYAYNIEELSIQDLWQPLALALLLAVVSYLVMIIVTNDYYRAAFVTTAFLIFFFLYGHLSALLNNYVSNLQNNNPLDNFTSAIDNFLLPLWWILFVLGTWLLLRIKTNPLRINSVLIVTGLVLMELSVLPIVIHEFKKTEAFANTSSNDINFTFNIPQEQLPDIYYIVLDGYARDDTLEILFEDDNSMFLDFLTANDFVVAKNSRTNYVLSFLSMASSLNMQYLDLLADQNTSDPQGLGIPTKMILESRLSQALKAQGYKLIHFNSGWSMTKKNLNADTNISYPLHPDSFQMLVTNSTVLKPFLKLRDQQRQQEALIYNFKQLAKMPMHDDQPIFVFAHLITPHPPYLFDSNCLPVYDSDPSEWQPKQKYYDNLQCLNKNMMTIIESLLKNSKVPPIIIIQGDHGPRLSNQFDAKYAELDNIAIAETANILNAYYVPGVNREIWYDSITPVNSWRMILKHYFGAEFELLPDRSYWSESKNPYQFIDLSQISSVQNEL